MILNRLSTWLEPYLAEKVGVLDGFHYSATEPAPDSAVLVTIGFMPEAPAEIIAVTGYDYPEQQSPTGVLVARVQVRARAATRARALDLADTATTHLATDTILDSVERVNLQPIGQDQMGNHEVTANLLVTTSYSTERNLL